MVRSKMAAYLLRQYCGYRDGDFARSRSSFDDCLVERSEFELPVPLSKLSDDSVVL